MYWLAKIGTLACVSFNWSANVPLNEIFFDGRAWANEIRSGPVGQPRIAPHCQTGSLMERKFYG
jgi:hypothetical protein